MRTLRNILFQIHLWTGLVAGIFLVLLGLSGSMLVYPQLFSPAAAAAPSASEGTPLPLEKIIDAARATDPQNAGRSATVVLPRQSGTAIGVRFTAQRGGDGGGRAGGRRGGRRGARGAGDGQRGADGAQFARGDQAGAQSGRDGGGRDGGRGGPGGGPGGPGGVTTYVNPVTAAVLGTVTPTNNGISGLAHELHELMLLGGGGRTLVAWLGVGMLFLGLSGLYLWWPKKGQWKYAFGVRRNARGVRFYREVHGMFGIWFWLVFLFVTVTSIPLGFPSVMTMLSGPSARPQGPPQGFGAPQTITVTPGASPLPLNELLADAAKSAGGTPASITVPATPDRAVSVAFVSDGPPHTVSVNPYSGVVLTRAAAPPAAAGGIDRRLIEQLHGGDGLGPVWKFLVFLTGFLPLIFVVTGAIMWFKKRAARMPMSRPLAET